MNENLDFNKLTLEDVRVVGKDPEPVPTPDPEPTPTPDPEPAPVPDPEPAPKPDPVPAPEPSPVPELKFKDDFIKGAVEYYEKTGDLTPYLQAKTVDFEKMTDEEVMRRSLQEQYPNLSQRALDKLFNEQVVEKYKLDDTLYGEEDVELGRALLSAEASKKRQEYLDWQKSFKAPEPKNDEPKIDQAILDQIKQFEDSVKTSPVTKSILDSKRVTVKDGDVEFNYEIAEPDSLVEMTLNNDKFFSNFAKEDGSVDLEKWYLAAAIAKDPTSFIKSLGNFYKGLGREELAREIKNPSDGKAPDAATDLDAGDFKTGLLRAFADKGVKR